MENKQRKKRGRPAKRARRPARVTTTNVPAEKALQDYNKQAVYILRGLRYSVETVAQIMEISETTVKKWDKEVGTHFAHLPAVRTAIDVLTSKIPRALRVYDKCLSGTDLRLARDAARDILLSSKVIKDRQTVEIIDDSKHSDSDLIAEAERIMLTARSKVSAGSDNK